MLIGLSGITRRFGEHEVLRGVDWQIHAGERWALVGPNGSGKTTLLRFLAGKDEGDSGEVRRVRGLRVATVPQDDLAGVRITARAYLLRAFSEVLEKEAELSRMHRKMSDGDTSQGTFHAAAEIQEWLLHHGGYTYEVELERTLLGLGFSLDDADRPCSSFSGGEQMRLKLGRALLDPADLLLLDEPGNHLDESQREWLGDFLRTSPRSFVVVTHDPEILESAVDHVAYLMDGKLYTFRGDFASFEVQFEEMQKTRERAWENQQAYIERTQEFIRRYKAGQRSKQARGREKVLSRLERVEAPVRSAEGFRLQLAFDDIPGEDVLNAEDLLLALGERRLRVPKLHLKRGQKVALVGANGAGKTTLLRALLGEVELVSGVVRWGTNVRLAHYDQHQRRFDFQGTLFDTVGGLLKSFNKEMIYSYLGAFGFGGPRADQSVGSLSGGERARLHLLGVLLARANVIFLDEPTNHLDEAMVSMLQEALAAFKGTLVVVSHDEAFLRSVTHHTWGVAGDTLRSAAGFAPDLAEARVRGPAAREEGPARNGREGGAPKPALSKNELFRLQRRRQEAEAAVGTLTKEKARMEARFASPDSVVTEDWHALNRRYEKLKRELAAAEEEWLAVMAQAEEAGVASEE